jgi:hypothetical protein
MKTTEKHNTYGIAQAITAAMLMVALLSACNSSTTNVGINLSSNTATLEGKVGQTMTGKFTVENSGSSEVKYNIASDAAWLTVTPKTSTLAIKATQEIEASAKCNAVGELVGKLTITLNDNASLNKTFTVTLKCLALDITPKRV